MPKPLRNSTILTGNDLGMLAGKPDLPTAEAIAAARTIDAVAALLATNTAHSTAHHQLVQSFLRKGDIDTAWAVAML